MTPTFGGQPIFGFPVLTAGPTGDYRTQDEQLPGVDGVRVYRLGRNPETWRLRGRLTGTSLGAVRQLVSAGKGYVNGQLYSYSDSAGHGYANCQLMSFNPVGNYEGIVLPNRVNAVTVEVDAVVRWVSPTGGLG